jgi:hypothetical protein
MDILITSTGNIWRRIDDGVALMLIDALPSIFERVKAPAPAPPPASTTPVFYVGISEYTGNIGLFVKLPTGETRSAFKMLDKKQVEQGLGAGVIPQAVWDSYEAKVKAEQDLTRAVASQGTTYR